MRQLDDFACQENTQQAEGSQEARTYASPVQPGVVMQVVYLQRDGGSHWSPFSQTLTQCQHRLSGLKSIAGEATPWTARVPLEQEPGRKMQS